MTIKLTMTKNIKKSNKTSKDRKPLNSKMQASKKPLPKTNSSSSSTTAKTKGTTKTPLPKKGSKVNLGITVFGLLLIIIVGTQVALNPKPKKANSPNIKTINESTPQTPSYPYFSNINNTFSSIFLSELNNYRETKGLSDLQRVRSISKGTTVTLQIPDIEQVAKNQNLNTETLLAQGVLHKFLESNNNVVIANANVPTVFLNTEMIDGTLTLTVTVPYEKSATQPQTNNQREPQVQSQQPQQYQSQIRQQPSQQQTPITQQQPRQPEQQQQQEPRIRHHETYTKPESSNENTSNENTSNDNDTNTTASHSRSDNNTGATSTSQPKHQ